MTVVSGVARTSPSTQRTFAGRERVRSFALSILATGA